MTNLDSARNRAIGFSLDVSSAIGKVTSESLVILQQAEFCHMRKRLAVTSRGYLCARTSVRYSWTVSWCVDCAELLFRCRFKERSSGVFA